ncbi:MAG: S46 family peptidase [Bacteroidota bacterium]
MYRVLILCVALCVHFSVIAHEGLWMPFLLEHSIFPSMEKQGCKISPQDIYDVENPSLKDAIVKIGNGCSGGIISEKGLVITNYHCVEYFVQQASSLSQNYIKTGLWAQGKEDEIPARGLTVSVLSTIEDVTDIVLSSVSHELSEYMYAVHIDATIDSLIAVYESQDSTLEYSIEPFWSGNQYFLFSSRVYRDVRLVGFMPADIASFGADKDNWKWPRHTADFALLRMYVDTLNNPALYSPSNIPYIPPKSISLSTTGVAEGDFTMVMGYPAETDNFSTAHEVSIIYDSLNPLQIALREQRLKPIAQYMKRGESEHLQYYTKYYRLLNYYEKWQGEQFGIENAQVIKHKKQYEQALFSWLKNQDSLYEKYDSVLYVYNQSASRFYKSYIDLISYFESFVRMDFFRTGQKIFSVIADTDSPCDSVCLNRIQSLYDGYAEKVNVQVEKESFLNGINYLFDYGYLDMFPEQYRNMTNKKRNKYFSRLSRQSFLFNTREYDKILSKCESSEIPDCLALFQHDKGMQFIQTIYSYILDSLYQEYVYAHVLFNYYQKEYVKLNMEYAQTQGILISPDANGTLRVSFGGVRGYTADSLAYDFYTTAEGIISKNNVDSQVYVSDSLLFSYIQQKDYGSYSKDTLHVNFIADNQTSGGNSGSPVFNAYGHMIGLNFDRNYHGTMSDLYFDSKICRNIMVDVKYILFCIEKYGKSEYILQELMLVE